MSRDTKLNECRWFSAERKGHWQVRWTWKWCESSLSSSKHQMREYLLEEWCSADLQSVIQSVQRNSKSVLVAPPYWSRVSTTGTLPRDEEPLEELSECISTAASWSVPRSLFYPISKSLLRGAVFFKRIGTLAVWLNACSVFLKICSYKKVCFCSLCFDASTLQRANRRKYSTGRRHQHSSS